MTAQRHMHQGAAIVVVALALFRCLIVIAPQMYFAQDPRLTLLTTSGVGPAGSLLLDTLTIAACGVVLLTARRVRLLPIGLALVGFVFIALHAATDAGDMRVGSAWFAALSTGLAALHFGDDVRLRRLALALALALIGALAVRGAYQVFVEHPQTLAYFRAHEAEQLAAQGHEPGSTGAKLFERRLSQPEASAWLGLANVYGSLAAALLLGWLALLIAAVQRFKRGAASLLLPAAMLAGVLCTVAALLLSHSKGAIGAALLGLIVLGLIAALRSRQAPAAKVARVLGPALILLVLFGVVVRGALLGEVLDPKLELSLLFRWHYLIGSARIIAHEPLLGVGPDEFKAAYLMLKPAFSPEEVTSPHSILFDYLATLGVGGAALAALFVLLAQRAGLLLHPRGAAAAEAVEEREPLTARHPLDRAYAPALLAVLLAIVALRLETGALALPDLLARLGGGAVFAMLAGALWRLLRAESARAPAERAALLGASAVLIAHTQIEMTATQPGSAALTYLLLGLAANLALQDSPAEAAAPRAQRLTAGAAVVLTALLILCFGYVPEARRQAALHDAALALQPAAEIRWKLADLDLQPETQQRRTLREVQEALRHAGIGPLTATNPQFVSYVKTFGLARLEVVLSPKAIAALQPAFDLDPASPEPRWQAVRLNIARAFALETLGEQAAAHDAWRDAYAGARTLVDRFPDGAAHHRLSMQIAASLAERGDSGMAQAALDHAEAALALDPHSLTLTREAADLAWELKRSDLAWAWYKRLLTLNEQHRLDPLEQLDEQALERARERSDNTP